MLKNTPLKRSKKAGYWEDKNGDIYYYELVVKAIKKNYLSFQKHKDGTDGYVITTEGLQYLKDCEK